MASNRGGTNGELTALATGDGDRFITLVGGLERIYGMAEIAEKTGLNRSQLYRSYHNGGNPSFKSMLCCLQVLGLTLTVAKAEKESAEESASAN